MIKNKTGAWGEIYAARYLRERKYAILTSNFVCRLGEIDIVAEKKNVLAFVEVKTRNVSAKIRPMEAVDFLKQERIRAASKIYLKCVKLDMDCRFDVCEVYINDDMSLADINYIENAF